MNIERFINENTNLGGSVVAVTYGKERLKELLNKYTEELDKLVEKRKELKAVEKKYFDFESPKEYLKAHKLRKQTEKAIFKILENEK